MAYRLWATLSKVSGIVPVRANTFIFGFICNTQWKPVYIDVKVVNEQQFEYEVAGTVEWNLLGMPVAYRSRAWTGLATINTNQELFID